MKPQKLLAGCLLGLGCCSAWAGSQDSSNLTVGLGTSYFEGKYGTTTTTKVWYTPLTLAYKTGEWRLKLTVPYLTVEGKNATVSGNTIVSSGAARRSGLGDSWLEGKYRFASALGKGNDISPYLKVKLDTSEAGLGSGQTDVEIGGNFDFTLNADVYPFLQAGYRFVGSPPNQKYNDTLGYSAGTTLRIAKDDYLTAMYSGREAQIPGNAAASDAIVAWNHNFKPGAGIQFYLDKGLSDGSPDYGVGISGTYRF